MSYIYYDVRLYKRLTTDGGNWSTDYTSFPNATRKNIIKGIATKKDTFSFNILNNYNKYFTSGPTFESGDKIGLQILYCPGGSFNLLSRVSLEQKSKILFTRFGVEPLLSNRLEFVIDEHLLALIKHIDSNRKEAEPKLGKEFCPRLEILN